MKTVVICIRNLLFAQGIELALRATGDFRPYRVTPAQPGNAVPVCMAHSAQILLLEVTPQNLRLRKSILDHSQRMKAVMRARS